MVYIQRVNTKDGYVYYLKRSDRSIVSGKYHKTMKACRQEAKKLNIEIIERYDLYEKWNQPKQVINSQIKYEWSSGSKISGGCKFKDDLELVEQLSRYAIAYVEYCKAGGSVSDYSNKMMNNIIDVAMKIKFSRDQHYEYMQYQIPIYNKGIKIENYS